MYWSVLTFLGPDLPYALNSNPEQVIFCTQGLCNFKDSFYCSKLCASIM